MNSINKLCFIILISISSQIFSQSKNNNILINKQYQYSFEGALTTQSTTDLENKLVALTFVTMAKVKYKADSQKGEVFLQTREKTITSESDKGFDLIELKKLLISNNLTPIELTTSVPN